MTELWSEMSNTEKRDTIRMLRNIKLSAYDWTQLPDAPLTDTERSAWADYRQALRDLPASVDDADNVVWPEVPA